MLSKKQNEKTENEKNTQPGVNNANNNQSGKKEELVQIKASELERLNSELNEEREKAKQYWDRFLRLQAEFDNAKKRMQKQQEDFVKYANESLICELLGILDDLERSIEACETKHQDSEAFLKGIEIILSHLYELLKKNNVKPIEAKGKIFDPNYHEALMQVENNELPENTVVEELQKGYLLGDRVIRTAKVKVSKRSAPSEQTSVKGQSS